MQECAASRPVLYRSVVTGVLMAAVVTGCGLDSASRNVLPAPAAIVPEMSTTGVDTSTTQSTQTKPNRFLIEAPVSLTLEVTKWSEAENPLRFAVVATYSDATHEDVTPYATFVEVDSTLANDVALLDISVTGDIRYRLAGSARVKATLVGLETQMVDVSAAHASPSNPKVTFSASSTASSNDSVFSKTALTCSATGSTDPEGTIVDYEFEWSGLSGTPVRQLASDGGVSESYITRNEDRGSTITCRVAARDSASNPLTSHWIADRSFTVHDRAPSQPSVALYQAIGTELKVGGQIRCLAQGSIDADEDSVIYEFRWNNISSGLIHRESNASETYTITESDIGKPMSCEARAISALDNPAYAAASSWGSSVQHLELQELPPVVTSLTLVHLIPDPSTLPANTTLAQPGDVLVCTATGYDPNGLTARWGLTGGTINRVKIFEVTQAMRGKTITCAAQLVNSLGLKSALVQRTMNVINRAPDQPTVEIASFSSNIIAGTTLSCNGTGTDPDGDQVVQQYSWSGIAGSVDSSASNTYTVTDADTGPITCSVTLCDVYPYRDIAACQTAIPEIYAASGPTACCHKTSPAGSASVVLGNNYRPNPPNLSSIGAGLSTNVGQGKVTGIWASGDGSNPPVATTSYLVVLYPVTTQWSPADGAVYSTGAMLANGVVIGYAGPGVSSHTIGGPYGKLGAQFNVDYGRYYYAVYARGANGRYSNPVTGEFTVGVTMRVVGPTPSLVRAQRDSVYWDVIYDGASTITLNSGHINPYGSPVGITSGTPVVEFVNGTTRRVTIGNISGAGTLRFGIAANSAQSPSGNALAMSSIRTTPVQVEMRNFAPTDPVVDVSHQDGILTCSATSTDANGDPFTYTRQWTRDGSAIVGATGETYALSLDDEYSTIRCEVYAADAWLMSNTITSSGYAVNHFCSNFTEITAHDGILGYPDSTADVNNPYLLCNAAQVTDIADQCGYTPGSSVLQSASCGKHFRLKQNIEMSDVTWTDSFIGDFRSTGAVPFTGSILGGGAGADSIRGLTITTTSSALCPAFVSYLLSPGSLRNFALDRLTVSGVSAASAITCQASVASSNLSGIRASGVVSANSASVIGQKVVVGNQVSSGQEVDFSGLLLTPLGTSNKLAVLSSGVVDRVTAFVSAVGPGGPRLPWGQDSVIVGSGFASDLANSNYGTHSSLFGSWVPNFVYGTPFTGAYQSATYMSGTSAESTRQLAVSRTFDYNPQNGAVVVNLGQNAVYDTQGPGLASRPCLSTASSGGTTFANRQMRNVSGNIFASINSAVRHGPDSGLGPNSLGKIYDCSSGSAPYPEHIPTKLSDSEAYPASLAEAMTKQTYVDRGWDFTNTWDFDDALPYLRTTTFPISYFNATALSSAPGGYEISLSLTKSASATTDSIKIFSRLSNANPRVMPSCGSANPGTLIGTLGDMTPGMKSISGGSGWPGASDFWICTYKDGQVVIDGILAQTDVQPQIFKVMDVASADRLQFEIYLNPEVASTFKSLHIVEGSASNVDSAVPTYCGSSAVSNIVAQLDLVGASTGTPITLTRSLNSPQTIEAGDKVSYLLCGEMKSSFVAANSWADQGASQPSWMTPMYMIQNVETRAAPVVSSVSANPASPTFETSITVSGLLSMDGTIGLYSDSDCTVALAQPVSRATIEGSGVQITVQENATTSIYSKTFALDGTPSTCQLVMDFVNSTSVPSMTFVGNSTSLASGFTSSGPVTLDGTFEADSVDPIFCWMYASTGTASATISAVNFNTSTMEFAYTLSDFTGDGTVRVSCLAGALTNSNGLSSGEILGPIINVDNTPPVLGGDQTVLLASSGTIDATATDAGSGVATINWTQISGTTGAINLSSWTTLTPTVTATQSGTYGLQLTVSDAMGNTATRDFTVTWDTSTPSVVIGSPSVSATNGSRDVYWLLQVSGAVNNPSAADLANNITLNSTGSVTATKFVRVAGDANNDGIADGVDADILQNSGKYNTGLPATWAEGDFTGDGICNFDDALVLFPNYGLTSPNYYVVAATNLSGNGSVGFTVAAGAFANQVGTGSPVTTAQSAAVDTVSPTFNLVAGVVAASQTNIAPTAVNDSGSGIASYAWSYTTAGGGTIDWNGSENSPTATVSASADGSYTLKLRVTDNAGNYMEKTSVLTWSTVVPQVLLTDLPTTSGSLAAGTFSLSYPITFQNCATTQSNSNLASTYIVQLFDGQAVPDGSASNFTDVTTNVSGVPSTCGATPTRCSYRQNKAGLEWTDEFSARPWAEAFAHCRDLTYNGHTDWYLPGTPHIKRGTQSFADKLNQMVLPNAVWLASGDYLWSSSWNSGYTFTGTQQSSGTYNATSPASAPASPATKVDAITGAVSQSQSNSSVPFLCARSVYARAGTVSVSGSGSYRTVTLSNITGGDGTLGIRVLPGACTSIAGTTNQQTDKTQDIETIDTTPPVVTLSGVPATASGPFNMTVTVEDDSVQTGEDFTIDSYLLVSANAVTRTLTTQVLSSSTINSTTRSYVVSVAGDIDTNYDFGVKVADFYGNVGVATGAFTLSTSAATVAVGSPSDAGPVDQTTAITYPVTYSGASNIILNPTYINDPWDVTDTQNLPSFIDIDWNGTGYVELTISGSGNNYQVTVNNYWASGTFSFRFLPGTATNAGGQDDSGSNWSTPIVFDNSPPTLTSPGNVTATAPTTLTVGAVDPQTSMTYQWTNLSPAVGTLSFGTPNAASTTVQATAAGTYTVRFMATNEVGLSSSITLAFTWAPTAPTVTISSPSAAVSNGSAVSYGVSFAGAQSMTFNSSKVVVNKTGTANASVVVSGSGSSYTVTLTPSGNGTLGITVAAGSASNYGATNTAATSNTFTIDTLDPVVAASNIPNTGVPVSTTWSVSDSNSYSVQWTKVSGPGTINFSNPTATTTTISATAGGTYTVRLTATDTAGNSGYADRSFQWNSTAPGVSISAPSVSQTRTSNVAYTVTYSGASTVTLSSGNVTLNKTGTANATVSVSGSGTSSRTVTLSSISGNGTIGISLVSGTASNNGGILAPSAGPSQTFKVDNSAPTASIASIGAISTSTSITATASDPDLTAGIAGVGGLTYSWSKSSGPGTLTFSSPTSASTSVSASSDGNYVVAVTVVDAVGNQTTATQTMTWAATRPTLYVTGGSLNASSAAATFSVVYDANASNITLSSGSMSLIKTGSVAGGSIAVSGSGNTRTVTVSGLSGTGTLALVVAAGTATNLAGLADNTGATSAAISMDLNVPAAPTISSVLGGNGQTAGPYTNSPNYWTVYATCDSSVVEGRIFIDGVQRATASCNGSYFQGNIALTLAVGSHNITAKVVNSSGIVSGASASWPVVVDLTAPTLSSVSIVGGNSGTSLTPTVAFTLTDSSGSGEVKLHTGSSCLVSDRVANSGSITTGSGQTLTTSTLSGSTNLYIKAIDAARNWSACTLVGYYSYAPPTAVMTPAVTQGDTFGNGYCAENLTVKLASGTPGATIYYTTNGSTPTTSSYLYNASTGINLSSWGYNVTIKAIAVKAGMLDSSVMTKTWNLGVPYEVLATVSGLGAGKSVTTNLHGNSLTTSSTTVAATKVSTTNGTRVSSYGWCNGAFAYHATVATHPTGQTCYVAYAPGLTGPSYTPKKVSHEDVDFSNNSVHSINCVDDSVTAARLEVSFEDLYGTTNPTFAIGSYEKDSDYNDLNVCLSMNGALTGNNLTKSLTSGNFRMVANVSGTLYIDWYSETVCSHPFRVKLYRNGSLVATASAVGSIDRLGRSGLDIKFDGTTGGVPDVLVSDINAVQPIIRNQDEIILPERSPNFNWILTKLLTDVPIAMLVILFILALVLSDLFSSVFRQWAWRIILGGIVMMSLVPKGRDNVEGIAFGQYGGSSSSSSGGLFSSSSSTSSSSSSSGGLFSSSSSGGFSSSTSSGGGSGSAGATLSGVQVGDVIEVEMDNPVGSTCSNYGASSTIYSKYRDQSVIRSGCAIVDSSDVNANTPP